MPTNTVTMVFNEETGQYQLTEQALIECGLNIRGRLARHKATSPEYIINYLIELTSDMIYNYLHEFTINNDRQDCIIANCDGARSIMEKALKHQAIYIRRNGDLSLSVREEERSKAISPHAISVLNKTVKELGSSLTYMGV